MSYSLPFAPSNRITIRRFVSYLNKQGLSGASASVYVAGVRSYQLEEGHDDPCKNDLYLGMMLKGFTNETRPVVARRKPLTLAFLRRLRGKLFESVLNAHDLCMLWAAFTLAFYGMLRVSEYTSCHQRKFTSVTLLRRDIELTDRQIKISLKRDKTHQRTIPPPIFISGTNSECCPVLAMKRYLTVRSGATSSPLFIFKNGAYLTRQRVNKDLCALLGPDFTSHSFRIGAASTASRAGCSSEQIRVMGRWRSNVSNRYVRPDYLHLPKLMEQT